VSQKIIVLVASMSGTAELAADVILEKIKDAGIDCRIVPIDRVTGDRLAQGGSFIICTSTYGTGEVPDKAKPLIAALEANRPNLTLVRYAVFGLGDSIYPTTFCFGGKIFDEVFKQLGATKVAERCNHDSRSAGMVEDVAAAWVESVLERFNAAVPAEEHGG
jgi:MioC protein